MKGLENEHQSLARTCRTVDPKWALDLMRNDSALFSCQWSGVADPLRVLEREKVMTYTLTRSHHEIGRIWGLDLFWRLVANVRYRIRRWRCNRCRKELE